ncbi:MAG: enoyl-CoA hydratase/isomerase family protein [Hyphomonas sp.]|uniref:enoyl-CoA hydratase/isomerase family protein n=1 Tax=Hyphomonas sp. TaxID=87 RepID=UPI0034A085FB
MANVTTSTKGATRLIRYANPPRHYMTAEGAGLMLAAVQQAVADPAVRVLVLTGTDDVFVRHYDVAEIIAVGEAVRAGQLKPEDFERGGFADMIQAVFNSPKPVIAAINGVCMGGGFELALACDLRIAGNQVPLIGLPETRVGIFPGGGGTQRLPRMIGEARALEFILRGQTVNATGALELGLVNAVAADAVGEALTLAEELSARGAEGLAHAKRLVRGALTWGLDAGTREEQHGFHEVLKADSAMAAMQDFLANGEDITR